MADSEPPTSISENTVVTYSVILYISTEEGSEQASWVQEDNTQLIPEEVQLALGDAVEAIESCLPDMAFSHHHSFAELSKSDEWNQVLGDVQTRLKSTCGDETVIQLEVQEETDPLEDESESDAVAEGEHSERDAGERTKGQD